jgi:hypothetical protein
MIEEIKHIKCGKRELRNFGITLGIIFGLLGGLLLWREKGYVVTFFMLSGFFLVFGLALPGLLKQIYKVWMTLALIMGWVMTRVILSILFYLLVTPIGLAARLVGKNFLDKKFKSENSNSYWIKKEQTVFKKSDFERQF